MSDYGADKKPDMNLATDIAFTKALIPDTNANVMQWTYPNGVIVQKFANRRDKSNCLIKLQT